MTLTGTCLSRSDHKKVVLVVFNRYLIQGSLRRNPFIKMTLSVLSRLLEIVSVSPGWTSRMLSEWANNPLLKFSSLTCLFPNSRPGRRNSSKNNPPARMQHVQSPEKIVQISENIVRIPDEVVQIPEGVSTDDEQVRFYTPSTGPNKHWNSIKF